MAMKRLLTALALTVALVACQPAEAQTAGTRVTPCNAATKNNELCLVFTAPIANTDGTPIAGLITYHVERLQQVTGGTWMEIATTSQAQYLVTNLAPGTYTFRVLAAVGTSKSAPSNTANGTATALPPPIPNPPVIQVVQVIIGVDHAPVYTVLSDGSRSSTVGGMVPVGTVCEGPVLFRYRGKDWRKPSSFKPWGVSSTARVAAPCA
jgi:hypothetical protein